MRSSEPNKRSRVAAEDAVSVGDHRDHDSSSSEEGHGQKREAAAAAAAGLSREEYEYHVGMMNAMEDGAVVDAEEEGEEYYEDALEEHHLEGEDYEDAVGMMNAMEDGIEGEEEGGSEDTNSHEGDDRRQAGALGSGLGLANNIVQACSSVSSAVRDYYRMSNNDQAQVWHDMTGAECIEETPSRVQDAQRQLTEELQRMPSSHNHDALDLALEQAPHFVNDPAFQLQFLRTEKFDVFATAVRMCRHFETKLELFPEEALGRDITLDDLNEDDMAALRTGYIQTLREKDHCHRPIIFYYKAISGCYKHRENILRAVWYINNRLAQDESHQKLGSSHVVYNIGGFPRQGMDYEKSRRLSHMWRALPLRMNTFYVCLDDKPWLTVVETFAVMITRFLRVRLRMLKGNHEEVLQKLEAVGIPAVSALPVNDKSELLVEAHLEWIEQQRKQEQKQKELTDCSNLEARERE